MTRFSSQVPLGKVLRTCGVRLGRGVEEGMVQVVLLGMGNPAVVME